MSYDGIIFGLRSSQLDSLAQAIARYPGDAETAVNGVLHGEAGAMIYRRINPLINPSGRTFKGHSASARQSDWPTYLTDRNLELTVKAQGSYNYLYFPDDGSSTVRHAGDQRFFERGGEAAIPEVMRACLDALKEEWS